MPRSFKTYNPRTYQRRANLVQGYQAAKAARAKGYRRVMVKTAAPAGEMKYFDSTKAATNLVAAADWTGAELDPNTGMFAPTVGATINQRIGRKVYAKSLRIRGIIGTNPATTGAAYPPCQVRLLLVQDTQTNAAQLNSEDVMQAPATATALAATNSRQALTQLGRYRVLKDKVFILQDPNFVSSSVAGAPLLRPFKFNIDLKDQIVTFNSTNGGTIADVVDNSWHIIAIASDIGMVPFIQYEARVSFKE